MAVGTGTYGAYVNDLILRSFDSQMTHAELFYDNTSISDTVAISFDIDSGYASQEMTMSAPIVFTISAAGKVNKLTLKDSSGTVKATISLTPVVYETPTYYTLSSLVIYNV